MRNKSKIIAFILSAIPGLAHFYIGLKERGLIFFVFLIVGVTGGIGLTMLTYNDTFFILTIIGYFVLGLIALIDMFSAWRDIEIRQLYNNSETFKDVTYKSLNKKSISLALSVIPGAGHMYLGYQKKGLMIMGAFLFSIFFMGWLGVSMLLFILPLIWFYSFFDVMHMSDGLQDEIKNQDLNFYIKPELVGIGLIAIGVIIILERILYPLISYEIRRYIQTTMVSLIFILIGTNMLLKGRNKGVADDEEKKEYIDED